MNISVNGEPMEFAADLTVNQLLGKLELAHRRVAVEVNEMIVPRSEHEQYPLSSGDRVEIVHAIGGG